MCGSQPARRADEHLPHGPDPNGKTVRAGVVQAGAMSIPKEWARAVTRALAVLVASACPVLASEPPDSPRFEERAPEPSESFSARQRLVGALYHYHYRHPDEGMRHPVAPGADPLRYHFPDPHRVSYLDPDWHAEQVREMETAGLDLLLAVFHPPSGEAPSPSLRGLPPLMLALDRSAAAGGRPPRVGLYLETSGLVPRGEVPPAVRRHVHLATPWGRERFLGVLRDFFEHVPPRHRAKIDGRLVVVVGSAFPVGRFPEDLFEKATLGLRRDLGTEPFFVLERSWKVEADARFGEGGALAGPVLVGRTAHLGPGFDDSRWPSGGYPIRDRERGRYYERGWMRVLRSDARLVILDSWNGLENGTAICSTRELGSRYVELTRKYVRLFHEGRVVPGEVVLEHPLPRPRPNLLWGAAARGARTVRFEGDPADRPPSGLALVRQPDGPARFHEVGGRSCALTLAVTPSVPRYLYFDVSDHFLFDERASLEVRVTFHEGTFGEVGLEYDSNDEGATRSGAYKSAGSVLRKGRDRWRTETFLLRDARFANRQNGGCDFRIVVRGTDLVVSDVVVRRHDGPVD